MTKTNIFCNCFPQHKRHEKQKKLNSKKTRCILSLIGFINNVIMLDVDYIQLLEYVAQQNSYRTLVRKKMSDARLCLCCTPKRGQWIGLNDMKSNQNINKLSILTVAATERNQRSLIQKDKTGKFILLFLELVFHLSSFIFCFQCVLCVGYYHVFVFVEVVFVHVNLTNGLCCYLKLELFDIWLYDIFLCFYLLGLQFVTGFCVEWTFGLQCLFICNSLYLWSFHWASFANIIVTVTTGLFNYSEINKIVCYSWRCSVYYMDHCM